MAGVRLHGWRAIPVVRSEYGADAFPDRYRSDGRGRSARTAVHHARCRIATEDLLYRNWHWLCSVKEWIKAGGRVAIGSFCSSGVIFTDNNSTPASEEVVTGRCRETRPSFCQSQSHLNRRLSLISCSRAIRATEAPGCKASLTI